MVSPSRNVHRWEKKKKKKKVVVNRRFSKTAVIGASCYWSVKLSSNSAPFSAPRQLRQLQSVHYAFLHCMTRAEWPSACTHIAAAPLFSIAFRFLLSLLINFARSTALHLILTFYLIRYALIEFNATFVIRLLHNYTLIYLENSIWLAFKKLIIEKEKQIFWTISENICEERTHGK